MEKDFDYIIAGQGLSGSLLAWFALKKGLRPLVIDREDARSASRVAAGLVNPITGRRMVKTWKADEIIPFALQTYREMESCFQDTFYHEINIQKVFKNAEQQNEWLARSADPAYRGYVANSKSPGIPEYLLEQDLGGIEITQSGFLDTVKFLNNVRKYLMAEGLLCEGSLDYADITVDEQQVCWQQYRSRYLVFCEGSAARDNPFFYWLPFSFVKGQILTIHAPRLQTDKIINRDFWLLPLGAGYFRAGSTYETDIDNPLPTHAGYEQLTNLLSKQLKVPYEVLDQQAGIRPATQDVRPFLGTHPEYQRLAILNGMGSKGVSLAPYFARQMTDFLENEGILTEKANIYRWYKRYQSS